jgi:hypothetical protein
MGTAALSAAILVGTPVAASAAPEVTYQQGYVAFCTGQAGGYSATVDLYQNSTVQVAPTAVIETADGAVLVGPGTTDGALFDDGTIDASFQLSNRETDTAAGSASLTGTYAVVGPTTRAHEAIRDANMIVVTTGTNTQLSTDLSLTYAGTTIDLTCDPAFAFDLTTRRQPIGGS